MLTLVFAGIAAALMAGRITASSNCNAEELNDLMAVTAILIGELLQTGIFAAIELACFDGVMLRDRGGISGISWLWRDLVGGLSMWLLIQVIGLIGGHPVCQGASSESCMPSPDEFPGTPSQSLA
jgi:hypothetical protein